MITALLVLVALALIVFTLGMCRAAAIGDARSEAVSRDACGVCGGYHREPDGCPPDAPPAPVAYRADADLGELDVDIDR